MAQRPELLWLRAPYYVSLVKLFLFTLFPCVCLILFTFQRIKLLFTFQRIKFLHDHCGESGKVPKRTEGNEVTRNPSLWWKCLGQLLCAQGGQVRDCRGERQGGIPCPLPTLWSRTQVNVHTVLEVRSVTRISLAKLLVSPDLALARPRGSRGEPVSLAFPATGGTRKATAFLRSWSLPPAMLQALPPLLSRMLASTQG